MDFFVWFLAILSFTYPTLYAIWIGCLEERKLKNKRIMERPR
jgi:hypothetical protein